MAEHADIESEDGIPRWREPLLPFWFLALLIGADIALVVVLTYLVL